MTSSHATLPAVAVAARRSDRTSWRRAGASLAFGVLSTSVIFSILAKLQRSQADAPEKDLGNELSYSAMIPPPPAPSHTEVPVEEESSPIGLPTAPIASERTDSPVNIAATPPDALFLAERAPAPVSLVAAQIKSFTPQGPRGKQGLETPNFIFERTEVDKLPYAIDKVIPRFRPGDIESTTVPSVNVLFIVEPNGEPSGVRLVRTSGSRGFDRALVEAISQWQFSPAVKKGKKVRCWVQQNVRVKTSGSATPFGS